MSRVMHRFEVPVDDRWHSFGCPDGEIKTIASKNSYRGLEVPAVEFWCEAEENVDYDDRMFLVVGTGQLINAGPEVRYVGTAPRDSAGLVWHLFERA